MDKSFDKPVAIFTFNRPQLTERLIGILAQLKPSRILVVSDGPRPDVADDEKKCSDVRRLFENLPWECHIDRNFAARNMGSFARNSSGLGWVFEQVEEAIILEDDCLPDPSFFAYCEELLERYRDNPRVGLISGNNFLNSKYQHGQSSYLYSAYATTWGWASWRSTWQKVNLDMPYWTEFRDSGKLRESVLTSVEEKYWKNIYNSILMGRMKNAWDYQLILTCLKFNLFTVIPSANLVSNVGFGPDGTHCFDESWPMNNVPRAALELPLVHPADIQRDALVDYEIFRTRFLPTQPTLFSKILMKSKIIRVLNRSRKKYVRKIKNRIATR